MAHNNVFARAMEYFNPPAKMVPEEGWRSLRWLPKDLIAGTVMTPVSYVFALSISVLALMSPTSGIYAGILLCILLWYFKATNQGIGGPAAALAPILAGAITALGVGSLAQGQMLVLPVIFTAGLLMFIIAHMKWARFTHLASPGVVEGSILGYIGYSIVVKQVPIFYGVPFKEKSLLGIMSEAFERVGEIDWTIMKMGLATLGIIIAHLVVASVLNATRKNRETPRLLERILTMFPGMLIATGVAIYFGYSLKLPPTALVRLPEHLTLDLTLCFTGFVFLLNHPNLWLKFGKYVGLLTLVDSVETCSTQLGLDQKDPHRRVVDPNLALKAAAVANMAGSQAGNQSHITGGMKGGIANALGAQTRNTALINGILMFVGIYFAATRDVLNHIPLVSLAAVIGFAGYRLCALKVWKHFWHLGRDPFLVFALGFLISAFTGDILYGFFGAMAIEFCIYYRRSYQSAKRHEHRGLDMSPRSIIRNMFRNPVVRAEVLDGVHIIELDGPLTPFNRRFYPVCPAGVEDIFLDCDHHEVTFVDYSWQVQCQKDREACCGKSNFKVHGFKAVSRGAAPGLYRYERRHTDEPTNGLGRRQADPELSAQEV